jgi:hypothetical protein
MLSKQETSFALYGKCASSRERALKLMLEIHFPGSLMTYEEYIILKM